MIEPDGFYSQVPNVLVVVYPLIPLLQDLESEVGHIEVGTWKIDLDWYDLWILFKAREFSSGHVIENSESNPPWNERFAHENQCFEDDYFPLGPAIFPGALAFSRCHDIASHYDALLWRKPASCATCNRNLLSWVVQVACAFASTSQVGCVIFGERRGKSDRSTWIFFLRN